MDHGESQLGWIHGNLHPDRMDWATRPSQSSRYPGWHHTGLNLLDGFVAIAWKANEAVAEPNVILDDYDVVYDSFQTQTIYPTFSHQAQHSTILPASFGWLLHV